MKPEAYVDRYSEKSRDSVDGKNLQLALFCFVEILNIWLGEELVFMIIVNKIYPRPSKFKLYIKKYYKLTINYLHKLNFNKENIFGLPKDMKKNATTAIPARHESLHDPP